MDSNIYIFISPHLDDAVLSCGGYIKHLASQGKKVVIATIVTADYDGPFPLSKLAQYSHRVWGGGNRPFVIRCREDKSAAKVLGAEIVHLGFDDCIYRRDEDGRFFYTNRVRAVQVHTLDWEKSAPVLQSRLKEYLFQYSSHNIKIVCPLSLGGHVDHILVRYAVEQVCDPQVTIYYEDFPYVLQAKDNKNLLESLTSHIFSPSKDEMLARLNASACYNSQIPGLFPSRLEILHEIMNARLPISEHIFPIRYNAAASIHRMEISIREYSREIGGERYWTKSNFAARPDEV